MESKIFRKKKRKKKVFEIILRSNGVYRRTRTVHNVKFVSASCVSHVLNFSLSFSVFLFFFFFRTPISLGRKMLNMHQQNVKRASAKN